VSRLFVVAGPIGNLKDITLRALETLKEVALIACEDTRHSLKLLNHYGIRKPLMSCHGHNEKAATTRIVSRLDGGDDVAYLSDAGTPSLSDPGAALTAAARQAGHRVVPIPGPSAFATLVSAAGVGGRAVTFEGFMSPKPGRRRSRLKELLEREEAFLIYESPHRLLKLMTDLAELESERHVVIGREMTKEFEEFVSGPAAQVAADFAARDKVLGECSVLVSGSKKR
jgi:16S rRNA (cytidine1402-2'-O)-methyltransferase